MKVLFYLKKNQTKVNGLCPVMGRITVGRTMAQFAAKLDADASRWDAKSGRMTGKSNLALSVNRKIDKINLGIHDHYREILNRRGGATAEEYNIAIKKDKAGNILMSKPATKGYEALPTVVLQSHMDMVCEKNDDKVFDFENDTIRTVVEGDWLRADGTTLGADNGIGRAAGLAILASNDIEHGPVECLFTVDEETGLTGARELEPGFMTGRILLNLDSEDEGELFIGCAGGKDTQGFLSCEQIPAPAGWPTCPATQPAAV